MRTSLLALLLAGLAAAWLLLPLPPGLVLVAGAGILPLVGRRGGACLVVGLPLLCLLLVWQVPEGPVLRLTFLDHTLVPLQGSAVGRLFATVFALAAGLAGLFALGRGAPRVELGAALAYAGSAVGVTLAGDLISLFVFWELMALASTVVLWSAGAWAASHRYILVHLLGGVLLMAGIVAHVGGGASVAVAALSLEGLAAWLMLAGFLVNAGAPPLSAWVADAYPRASPSGTVFLSAFTTKTAVFALWVVFPGAWVLVPVGLYMIVYGIVYALLEHDIRRLLVYSIVNQVGFMVVAVGIGSELALNGAAAHAFVHILYKALLLMSAAAVIHATGRGHAAELGGLARAMPFTTVCAVVGALSICAFPLTSGFVTKGLITEAVAEARLAVVWFVLTGASAASFVYVGLRYPWLVFFGRDAGLRPTGVPGGMRLAMGLTAGLCILVGIFPGLLYGLLPRPPDYAPYTAAHVVAQLQLLGFAGVAFFVALPRLVPTRTLTLDTDWFYRRFAVLVARDFAPRTDGSRVRIQTALRRRVHGLIRSLFRHHGPHGVLARTWPSASMVLWVTVILGACLLFYYV